MKISRKSDQKKKLLKTSRAGTQACIKGLKSYERYSTHFRRSQP